MDGLWQTYRERPEGCSSRGAVPMPRKREEDMCPVMNQFSYVNIVVPSMTWTSNLRGVHITETVILMTSLAFNSCHDFLLHFI
ncbi:hypothetical protein ScPMuIL_009028 [Solemya velum]